MDLIVRPAAAADVEEAFSCYEQQRPGLGEEFLDAVDAALREILRYPLRQAVIFRDMRRLLLKRFPYALFYRVYPAAIVVCRLYARAARPFALEAAYVVREPSHNCWSKALEIEGNATPTEAERVFSRGRTRIATRRPARAGNSANARHANLHFA